MPPLISEVSDTPSETSDTPSETSDMTKEVSEMTSETSDAPSDGSETTSETSDTTKEVSEMTSEISEAQSENKGLINLNKKVIMNKVKVNFEESTDAEIGPIADAVIVGCASSNTNFSVVTQLAAVVLSNGNFKRDLALCKNGDSTDTTNKNTNKGILVDDLRNLGIQVNVQAAGDRVKALSSKFPIVKDPSHHVMTEIIFFRVKPSNVSGYMEVSAEKPTYATHGTIFAYWDPALGPTPADKNKWFQRHSNGHSLLITGFTPGVTYPFAAAYKGLDNEPLIWCDTINRMAT